MGAEGKPVEDWKAPYLANAERELLQVSINLRQGVRRVC